MIFGQIIKCSKNNNIYRIKPKYLIGCGLVELEEFPELFKKYYSLKFHFLLTVIGGITILHMANKFLFYEVDKNIEKKEIKN
jgi:hypothetical protein